MNKMKYWALQHKTMITKCKGHEVQYRSLGTSVLIFGTDRPDRPTDKRDCALLNYYGLPILIQSIDARWGPLNVASVDWSSSRNRKTRFHPERGKKTH